MEDFKEVNKALKVKELRASSPLFGFKLGNKISKRYCSIFYIKK